ncbi:aspartyl-phosphate phosphatase Spo0E family protein [Fictibacillus enclensis]|uniref:aspartyl-phosphate phosphatase Spo0E family protein n=1 Tax=Fictibacillus enclensis TaxID=1017270 RepID=UPI0025A0A991|nr:aspartyl-phosphate phosphatase Spo0E family protein [Fictibacillus enclensis]MDM5200349.1 aspartyl-phosphate phosphatase Spo0E family protein [Fictibacillus enclensis]MDM5339699.1 aspartyl-phosphate phosphatase Spo0E family protein [Fictibacillus enclensis]
MTNLLDGERLDKYNEQIEHLRQQMIDTANSLGLNHPQVLNYSQKIDETHNLILKMEQGKQY